MKRLILLPILLFLLSLNPKAADKPVDVALSSAVMRATALLYSQDAEGNMRMRCTATAFDKQHGGYLFVSAAHCAGSDKEDKAADASDVSFYITFDERMDKVFYPATVKGVGLQKKGDDFSYFWVQSDKDWPTVPLGDEGKIDLANRPDSAIIINAAAPLGLGKQLFKGYVTNVYLDRPVVEGDINWKGTMLLQIQAGPGSSGSAIVSEEQKAIVGFLVGTVGGSQVIAMPVSRFKKFKEAVEAKKYPWWKPESDHDSPEK